jgi:hypothetical protein
MGIHVALVKAVIENSTLLQTCLFFTKGKVYIKLTLYIYWMIDENCSAWN